MEKFDLDHICKRTFGTAVIYKPDIIKYYKICYNDYN